MKIFYKSLYKSNNVQNADVYLKNLKTNKVSGKHYNEINENMTESELLKIVKSLQNNKSPGEDGLPAEFYKFFWHDIKTQLLNAFAYSSNIGSLSITQRRGILCLIPKKTDPLRLNNWRPLSLLNQDYKIMAKLVAERIKICLPSLIDLDQSGFLKGRFIGQNITTVFDIIHFAETENIPAILVSVDFEKAFDKLEWSFIHKCLEKYNFPPFIRQWVEILYTNIVSCVTNNGWHSDYFKLSRGVRQGCPLSPYLFIICAEFLAEDICQNNKIQGIKIGPKDFKIKQYADDTQIFSHFTEASVNEIIKTFSQFSSVSGLEINYNKTEVMRIGSIKNSDCMIKTQPALRWTSEPIKILGITLTPDITKVVQTNIKPLLEKVKNLIQIWSQRKLTLFGKVTVIKSLLESQLVYRLSTLPSPSTEMLKTLDKILFNFLWDNKPHKIAKTVTTKPRADGGLAMIDIEKKHTALKIAWIKRIMNETDNDIYTYLNYYAKTDIRLLIKCNLSVKDINQCWKKTPPIFWLDVLKQWCHYNFVQAEEVGDPKYEIPWFNSNIKIKNKVVYYKSWHEKNVIYIKDLLDHNGNLMSFSDFQQKYETRLTFLYYLGLLGAIPSRYKELLGQTFPKQITSKLEKIIKCQQKVTKLVYDNMIKDTDAFPTKAYQKHKSELNIELSKEDFLNLFSTALISTTSTKLRDIQFRILHHTMITNEKLFKWGLVDNNKCTFCHRETESIVDLLLRCEYVRNVWCYMENKLQNTGITILLNEAEKLLGIANNENDNIKLINLINMVIKQYIYMHADA